MADRLGDGASGRALAVLIATIGLGFAAVLLVYGVQFVGRVSATTPVLGLPQSWAYTCLPVAGVIMTAYGLRDLWQALRWARPIRT